MMAITERSVVAAIMTFLLYGVLPLTIILYLMASTRRRRQRARAEKIRAEMAASTTPADAPSDHAAPP